MSDRYRHPTDIHEILDSLLDRYSDDDDAWNALSDEGWLDVSDDEDGTNFGVILASAEVVGRARRALPVSAHHVGLSTLRRLGDYSGRVAVLTDARVEQHLIIGRRIGRSDADWIVISGPGLLAIAAGSACRGRAETDLLEPIGVTHVELDLAVATLLDDSLLQDAHEERLSLLFAAEATSALRSAFDQTLEHLQQRQQFGRPLAANQALQHRMVDIYLRLTLSDALIRPFDGLDEWPSGTDCRMAGLVVGGQGVWAAEEVIQLNGGMGFSWETGLHLSLRFAQRSRLLLGGYRRSARRIIDVSRPGADGIRDWTRARNGAIPPTTQTESDAI